jgi:hypothetical protein
MTRGKSWWGKGFGGAQKRIKKNAAGMGRGYVGCFGGLETVLFGGYGDGVWGMSPGGRPLNTVLFVGALDGGRITA